MQKKPLQQWDGSSEMKVSKCMIEAELSYQEIARRCSLDDRRRPERVRVTLMQQDCYIVIQHLHVSTTARETHCVDMT